MKIAKNLQKTEKRFENVNNEMIPNERSALVIAESFTISAV